MLGLEGIQGAAYPVYTLIGDAATVSFPIQHDLGTNYIHVECYRDVDGNFENVTVAYTIVDENNITVDFTPAPGSGETYRVVVSDARNAAGVSDSGGTGSGSSVLEHDLTFSEKVGGVAPGTTFPEGTEFEDIFKAMGRTVPTYTSPTLSLSYPLTANSEVGTSVSASATPSWNQNDAGAATSYVLKKGSETIHTAAVPEAYPVPTWTLTETAVTFQASVSYAEGPVKQDSLGEDYPQGQIPAGTIHSNVVSLSGVRYLFWGKTTSDPASSAEIRSLANIVKNPNSSTQFNIVTGTLAAGQKITLWYPATLNDLESVSYVEGGNANYTDLFVPQSQIAVEGANGYSAVAYKGFTLTVAAAISSSMTLTVKL
jgi:hypothetical protein